MNDNPKKKEKSIPETWKENGKRKKEKERKKKQSIKSKKIKQANKFKDHLTAYKLIGTFVMGGVIFSVAIMISSTSASVGKKKECTSSVTMVEIGTGSSTRGLASKNANSSVNKNVNSSMKSKKNLNEIILNLTEKLPGMKLDVEVAARSLRDLTAAHRNINSKKN